MSRWVGVLNCPHVFEKSDRVKTLQNHEHVRGVVMVLILGGPSKQNHFRPFLSHILGGPKPYFYYSLSLILGGPRPPRPIVRLRHCIDRSIIGQYFTKCLAIFDNSGQYLAITWSVPINRDLEINSHSFVFLPNF